MMNGADHAAITNGSMESIVCDAILIQVLKGVLP